MFEKRLAAIEGAEFCVATASGMAAMFASVASIASAGDRVVASASMFSSCHVVLTEILPRWGIKVELVKGNDEKVWAAALAQPAKVVFIETPSNPLLEIVDIKMVSDLAHKAGALVIVDNVMASPVLQKPLQLGADVVMYSPPNISMVKDGYLAAQFLETLNTSMNISCLSSVIPAQPLVLSMLGSCLNP